MSGPNIIVLTIADHAEAHRLLGRAVAALSWANAAFIAAAQTPQWRAAMQRMKQDPKWRTANAAANRRKAEDPKWLEKWRVANAAAGWKRAHKQLVLPKNVIVRLYRQGWTLTAIARQVGTGTRPDRHGNPRIGRVRDLLKRAGLYKAQEGR
jgi:hypothetical protein